MDIDEFLASHPGDPLSLLVRQDLDPLSVDELTCRIAALEAEIERAVDHRASADAIFRR